MVLISSGLENGYGRVLPSPMVVHSPSRRDEPVAGAVPVTDWQVQVRM